MSNYKEWLSKVGYLVEEESPGDDGKWKVWRSKIDNSFLTVDLEEEMYKKHDPLYYIWKALPNLEQVQSGKDGRTSNIGFDPENNKWCGWSHRAIVCFGIGDRIFEEDYGNEYTPFVKHGSKIITSMDESKLSASKFAEYVS